MKKLYILFLSVLLSGFAEAQDYHLSQYEMSPLYLNPALTGRYFGEEADFRISGNYRTQWQKMQGKPYSTVATGYDMPLGRMGVGAYIVDNIAGDGNYSTLNITTSAAYEITDGKREGHHLTTGLQLGVLQKTMSGDDLLYESQYTTSNGLDAGIASGEAFDREHLMRLDANVGVFYKNNDMNKNARPFGGFSIFHVTMPDESFTGTKNRMPMRFNFHTGCDIQAGDAVVVVPTLLWMQQGNAKEINLGVKGYYDVGETPYNIMLGANYRFDDAFVIQAGLKQFSSEFRISYDVVPGYLNSFGSGRNGFEMGIIYTAGKKK